MLVVVHHVYQAYINYVLVSFLVLFRESIIFSEIMKPNPRRANHHEDFDLKTFFETPWNQSHHSIAKNRFHFTIDIIKNRGA